MGRCECAGEGAVSRHPKGRITVASAFNDVLEQALQLPPAEQARLVERLAVSMRSTLTSAAVQSDTIDWTETERAALLQVEPASPPQIVAEGLLGTWSDSGIDDGATWVNEQKGKRKAQSKWSPR